jgi:predicted amidohydrolase YtcJ
MHPMSGGLRLLRCRFDGLEWPEQVARAVRECADRLDDGDWLVATGLTHDAFLGRGPDRESLDELASGRPAYVATEEGFTVWVSTAALAAAGVGVDTPDPERGTIERDPATGAPSGTLRGAAVGLVRSRIPRPSAATYREALRRASALAHRVGITSVIDASVDPEMLDAYRQADDAGELTLRVVASQRIDPARGPEQVDELVARAREIHSHRLRADAAKIFLDGDFPDHTAALLEPYADAPGDRGDLLVPPERLDALVARLDAGGMQVHVHAMGDRAIRTALTALEEAVGTNPPWQRRHHLAHLGLLRLDEIPRFRLLGVAANVQPVWAQADDVVAETELVLGPERTRMLYPFAGLLRSGAVVVAGSDWPSVSMSPLEAIQVAVTRRPLDGSRPVWVPEQRAELREMLAAYTRSGAWLAGRPDETGTVEVGKAADLIVLDRNLLDLDPNEIGRVGVLLTLVDGSVVWESDELEHPARGAGAR